MTGHNSCAAIYSTSPATEVAIRALRESDFDMHKVSVISKGGLDEKHLVGCYEIAGHFGVFGIQDDFWNQLWSSAPAAVCFHLSESGPLFIAGALVGMLLAVLDMSSGPGDFNPLHAAFDELGMGVDDITRYLAALQSGCLVLLVQGLQSELEQAYDVLKGSQPLDVSIYLTGY